MTTESTGGPKTAEIAPESAEAKTSASVETLRDLLARAHSLEKALYEAAWDAIHAELDDDLDHASSLVREAMLLIDNRLAEKETALLRTPAARGREG